MISLVVVSHSRPLARAAVALAREMVDGAGPHVEVAAGLDEETLGTDAVAVAEAIGRAHAAADGDGVLLLLDLGSAVLSAEMALELLEPEVAAAVRISAAPLVEGLVVALVSAAAGADLTAVELDASGALRAKAEHLGAEVPPLPPTGHRTPGLPGGIGAELPVVGEHGLHARPAARLVACVARFAPGTTVVIRNLTSGRGPVDALSVSAVATLDAQRGHRLLAEAQGPDAEAVLAALTELAARAFGDLPGPAQPLSDVEVPVPAVSSEPGVAGSGLEAAVGPAVLLDVVPDPRSVAADDPATEAGRLAEAVEEALGQLADLAVRAGRNLGEGEAELFTAHATLLKDPQIAAAAQVLIDSGASAAEAWSDAVAGAAAGFAGLGDSYQRERAQDVRSIGERVLRLLLGAREPEVLDEGVLVVGELDPALAISLDASRVRGVVTREGGATGHGVLIAAARGIPVLTGAGARADVPSGTVVAFDARSGELVVDPDPRQLAAFEAVIEARSVERQAALHNAHVPALTSDRVRVRVKANVSSVAVARLGAGLGADGSGLVRTEAVFAQWRQAPSVDQQEEVYRALADVFHPHQVAIRTWDAGGDKPLAFIGRPAEANPFLGARGMRAFADDPALMLDQLEAICRVAVDRRVRVLFPMVTTSGDMQVARDLLGRAALRAGMRLPPAGLEVGIMVEVPAAALRISQLAQGLDFVSIGSNDLIQYVLAAERGNPALAAWSDRLEPAVLALIRHVADHVPDGVQVGLCGAMAADADLSGLLVGLGVEELSTTAAAVPMVKQRLRGGSVAGFRALADRALAARDAAEVQALVDRARPGLPPAEPLPR